MPLSPAPFTEPVSLVPLQRMTQGERWRIETMRSYRIPMLLWFTRGQGRITVNCVTRGYGAHNAIFLPAGTMHNFDVTAQAFGTAVFFAPRPPVGQELETPPIRLPDQPLHLRIRDAAVQGEVTGLLEQLQREIEGDRPRRDQAIACHGGLLSVWLERQAEVASDAQPLTAAVKLVRSFAGLIEKQLYTGQSVGDYAETLNVTTTHLSRICRQCCGMTASDILQDRIGFEARRLLLDTPLSVGRIAEVLGFSSAAYFSRAFHARVGQSPSAFRSTRQTP